VRGRSAAASGGAGTRGATLRGTAAAVGALLAVGSSLALLEVLDDYRPRAGRPSATRSAPRCSRSCCAAGCPG
jgi:hypothetical protein